MSILNAMRELYKRRRQSDRPGPSIVAPSELARMRQDWDQRADENAYHFIVDFRADWSDEEFYASGEQTVAEDILSDMENICHGLDPARMRVLEIGCGAGRVTRALAKVFGEVHGVDVSGNMIERARNVLENVPNAFVYQNSGADLQPVQHLPFDFAFSCCVFHHIPNVRLIEAYWRATSEVLRPGALFKFEVQGAMNVVPEKKGSWLGVPISVLEAVNMALRTGFEVRHLHGGGEERFWLWLVKLGQKPSGATP